jgi:predicted nucleic acid-binding Zn ribbon protein
VYPNVPECTCDRDDDEDEAPRVFCDYHENRLRHLRWDTLACIVIDYEAVLHANAGRLVPAGQCEGCDTWFLRTSEHERRFCSTRCRYRIGKRRQRERAKHDRLEQALPDQAATFAFIPDEQTLHAR